MNKRLPISVCVIAGAEANRIERCLRSVVDWVSEVVVLVNDDVQDGTVEIAEGLGATVFTEPWKGHVSQKNSAAGKAKQEWVFGLDADEVVSAELRAEITALFADGAVEDFDAFSVPRVTFYCGRWIRHGDWYPDRKTRLWKRGTACWGGKDPHDKLMHAGPVCKLRADLEHYSMTDLDHHVRKALAYAGIFARQYPPDAPRIGLVGLWMRPKWRFIRSFFIRFGFLDGWQGLAVATIIAFETFIRYAKVREIQQKAPRA